MSIGTQQEPMPFSLFVRLIPQCPSCGNPTPVGEIVDSDSCLHCGQEFSPIKILSQVFTVHDEVLELTGVEMNMGRPVTIMTPFQASFLYVRCQRCQTCKTDFDLHQYAEGRAKGGFYCAGCGTWHSVRIAPSALANVVPGASLIIGEMSMAPKGPSAPVVYSCAQCQGALQVTGAERTIVCTYCQASNFLPDSLWEYLHQQPQAPRIFFVCEGHSAESVQALIRARPE